MSNDFFLTEVAADWSSNLFTVQEIIREAEQATLKRSDKIGDPLFDTPNLPNFRGMLRWVMVQRHFEIAARNGRLNGITPHWINLGGVHVLELRGNNTTVMPCHLLKSDDSPRESSYRRSQRIVNQINPMLFNFDGEEESSADELLHLLLVHGGKNGEFAYLRAYTDPSNRAVFRNLSNNLMLMPTLLNSIDAEQIDEPEIGWRDDDSE